MSEHMRLLAEGYGYEGIYFVENYLYSNLTRAFYNDVEEYGQELAEDMYAALFGEEAREVFSYMNENYEYLEEAVDINSELLFEGYGEKQYLKERIDKGAAAGKAKGVGGFLKGLWNKVKGIGSGALDKLKGFVEKGIPWAKEIAQKGVSFFTSNPIGQIALPAVAIAGGATAGWKLLKKLKKGKVSDEEKQKYKEALQQKQGQIKKYVGKGNKNEEFYFKKRENINESVGDFQYQVSDIETEDDVFVVNLELAFSAPSYEEEQLENLLKSNRFKERVKDLFNKNV